MRLHDPESLRAPAARVFEREHGRIAAVLPDTVIEHIGATAIPGSWSKGDVDLLVRAAPERFAAAVDRLRTLYADHQRENWTPTFASFATPGEPVGVQLVALGSDDERIFREFRDRLVADPALVAGYNAVKREHEASDEDTYRAAKAVYVERVLAMR